MMDEEKGRQGFCRPGNGCFVIDVSETPSSLIWTKESP